MVRRNINRVTRTLGQGTMILQVASTDDVLPKVVAYAESYRAKLPSLQCDESIVSQRLRNGVVHDRTQIEATFRVKRDAAASDTFTESHAFKTVDGHPAVADQVYPTPFFMQGAFAKGVGFVPALLGCYTFAVRAGTSAQTLRIESVRKPVVTDSACEGTVPGLKGTTTVDRETGRVLRVERTVPGKIAEERHTSFYLAIEYGRVTLNGQDYWLPVSARSRDEKDEHRFEVHYSNFKLYGATVRMLPGMEVQPQ